LFFLGGHANLIGYSNDEFWGRKVIYSQNLFELKPLPDLKFSVGRVNFRRLSVLFQLDMGKVGGAPKLLAYRRQTTDVKVGTGFGLGFNTDLPYMPKTDIHFIVARPSETGKISSFMRDSGDG
jgi:hypothetical protein